MNYQLVSVTAEERALIRAAIKAGEIDGDVYADGEIYVDVASLNRWCDARAVE